MPEPVYRKLNWQNVIKCDSSTETVTKWRLRKKRLLNSVTGNIVILSST